MVDGKLPSAFWHAFTAGWNSRARQLELRSTPRGAPSRGACPIGSRYGLVLTDAALKA